MNTSHTLQGQERVAGALSYIFFAIPFLMKIKTEFTMFHAKQSLFLFVLWIIGWIVPFIGWIFWVLAFFVSVWAAYQSYFGNRFVIPYLGENMDTILSQLKILEFFSAK